MLKWLAGSRPKSDIVTDDPLATIRVERPLEIYAVSRVNPIFDEEDQQTRKAPKPESPGKSASSGYGNSSECSSEEPKSTLLRDDALTVLEQNMGFVKSILVAVSPRRLGRSTAASLTPIPEGKVDYCIPKPVWPRPDTLRESPEEALRKLSVTLSSSRHVSKMSRALSGTGSSSSSGFSELPYEDLKSVARAAKGQSAHALWETYSGTGVTQGDVHLKSKGDHLYYPPFNDRFDFTLDGPRAEQLLKKIRSAKQQRFWCRLITSLMGLLFFLLSVMVVSMLLTRGKRIFGPL